MSTKAERGTKRTCQNSECGSRFYDLNRDPIVCPICQSTYEVTASPLAMAAAAPPMAEVTRRAAKKPAYDVASAKPEDVPEAESEDLAVVDGDDEPATSDDDETFLEEEEEDGSDMSNIIGGPVAEPDEPQ
jgi:uncharacterized protein (TIGR02300 family)